MRSLLLGRHVDGPSDKKMVPLPAMYLRSSPCQECITYFVTCFELLDVTPAAHSATPPLAAGADDMHER